MNDMYWKGYIECYCFHCDYNGNGVCQTGFSIRLDKEGNCINKNISGDRMMHKAIIIWKFEDAPKEYQDLSENYGDEDWIAFVPEVMAKEYIGFLDSGTRFGNFTEEHDVEGGIIVIGCHA